jgi:flagellar basal-body rod protein FlgG
MFRALSTAASGMDAQQTRLDVTANNIANSSTPGFKKSRAQFQDLMYQTIRAPGAATGNGTQAPTGTQIGLGVRVAGTQRSHAQGSLRQTGNPLDMAIEGEGFFPVEMPTGETAYTRAGDFSLNAEGRIVTTDGYPLASDISVPPDAQALTIGPDGTVSALLPGSAGSVELGQVELATFANPAGLLSSGRNLFRATEASGAAVLTAPGADGAGALSQGTVELSNVSVVEEMIDLIAGQRAYEVSGRVVRAADEMLQQTANLR